MKVVSFFTVSDLLPIPGCRLPNLTSTPTLSSCTEQALSMAVRPRGLAGQSSPGGGFFPAGARHPNNSDTAPVHEPCFSEHFNCPE